MSNYAIGVKAVPEAVRELASGSVTANYVAIGTATITYGRIFRMCNKTDVDLYFSLDGVTNHFRIAANSFSLYDIATNKEGTSEWYLPINTTFYVKETSAGAPTSGSVWVEVIGSQVPYAGKL